MVLDRAHTFISRRDFYCCSGRMTLQQERKGAQPQCDLRYSCCLKSRENFTTAYSTALQARTCPLKYRSNAESFQFTRSWQLEWQVLYRSRACLNHSMQRGDDHIRSHTMPFFVITSNSCSIRLQNGGKPDSPEEVDPVKRYIRSARDLATTSATDTINT